VARRLLAPPAVRLASREGYERILTIVAEENERSVRLITHAGFTRVAGLDGDYALYRAAAPASEDSS
jgi:RimJ/RimL family protein N-acetyltransferase